MLIGLGLPEHVRVRTQRRVGNQHDTSAGKRPLFFVENDAFQPSAIPCEQDFDRNLHGLGDRQPLVENILAFER